MKAFRKGAFITSQKGAAAVEFALVSVVLIMVVLGIIGISRLMLTMNMASEATRLAARLAVICDVSDTTVKEKTAAAYPLITAANLVVTYEPAGCSINTCQSVSASIDQGANGVNLNLLIPFIPFTLKVPPFTTSLRRESLDSSRSGGLCS